MYRIINMNMYKTGFYDYVFNVPIKLSNDIKLYIHHFPMTTPLTYKLFVVTLLKQINVIDKILFRM